MTTHRLHPNPQHRLIHRKISGCFRNLHGAKRLATVRSYISTNRKQTQNIHRHLHDLFTPTGAWLPTP